MLTDMLKPQIQSKYRELLSKVVVFLHDNAHPHTATNTGETLWELRLDIVAHPP
jgi:hypothetical protein